MKALTYHGSKDVRVETVPDPALKERDDVLLRVTATAIFGSDLHLYRGKVPGMKDGDILGHEFMGIVEDVGPDVKRVRKGDRVVMPFTIACGSCYFCEQDLFSGCENTNPGPGMAVNKKGVKSGAGMFGYTHLAGGYSGGQAKLVGLTDVAAACRANLAEEEAASDKLDQVVEAVHHAETRS